MLANITIGVLLAISGGAKLKDPSSTADAFRALRLPEWLQKMGAPRLLPWAEVALAALLIFSKGWLLTLATVGAVLLMVAYTVVIWRALGFGEPVQCGCFGELGAGDVSRRTLARNILLTLLAALGLVGALLGVSIYGQPTLSWGWVAVALLSAAAVALSLGGGPNTTLGATGHKPWLGGITLRDAATGADVRVAEIARRGGGATLLFLLPGCGSCQGLMAELPALREKNPGRVIVPVLPEWAGPEAYAGTPDLHRDPGSNLSVALGMHFAPAALEVLGDGTAPGELIVGSTAVRALLDGTPVAEPQAAPQPEPQQAPEAAEEPDETDYVRVPIPPAVLLDAESTPHTLQELAAERPQLLVSINCLCAGPRNAVQSLTEWQERLPILDTRLVVQFRPSEGSLTEEQENAALYDHRGVTSKALEMRGQVSAVLLGADGQLAGGPVTGFEEVSSFVDDIAQEIAGALDV